MSTYASTVLCLIAWKLYCASWTKAGSWKCQLWVVGRGKKRESSFWRENERRKRRRKSKRKIKLLGNNSSIHFPSHPMWLSFQMRYTKKVSMWPVGLITKYGVSSPIVRNGTISGFYDGWIGGRKFPVDMAGFAVNVNFLLSRPNASMPYKPGYEEDGFLKSLSPLNLTEIEVMATNCTQVSVSR